MLTFNKNKGFTLIEVVVALGVLAIVFAGTVTLVVNVVKLTLSARERTEAVIIAQTGLAKGIQAAYQVSAATYNDPSLFPFDLGVATPTNNSDIQLKVYLLKTADYVETPSPGDCFNYSAVPEVVQGSTTISPEFNCNNFYHIYSTVTWRGQEYSIDQYINRDLQ